LFYLLIGADVAIVEQFDQAGLALYRNHALGKMLKSDSAKPRLDT
jgi:hypothetical protein